MAGDSDASRDIGEAHHPGLVRPAGNTWLRALTSDHEVALGVRVGTPAVATAGSVETFTDDSLGRLPNACSTPVRNDKAAAPHGKPIKMGCGSGPIAQCEAVARVARGPQRDCGWHALLGDTVVTDCRPERR